VYDSQVRTDLKAPASPKHCLWSWFDQDPTRALEELRKEAGGIDDVLWMRARRGVTR
jgi:hypothetical protein